MAANLTELLGRLSAKCNVLVERYRLVKQQRDEAVAKCEELNQLIDSLKARLQQAQTENEYLRISHKIAPTEQDTRQAQDILAAMIKKIDKCIARLRDD